MKNARTHSLPVTILAALALVVACLGAVGASYAAVGITAKQARKIANTVVTNRAKTLTVAKARKANVATKAATASTAADAAKLGGVPPSAYLDRVSHENLTVNLAIPAATNQQIMNPTGIDVPVGVGYLHVTAVASVVSGNANVSIWPQLDGVCVNSGDGYDHRSLGYASNQQSIAVDYVAAVTPGNHAVRLCARAGAATFAATRSLTIQTVALRGN